MKNDKFKGLFTALVTPFKNGQIDYKGLENLIEFQVKNRVHGIVIAGSTGEKFSLNQREYQDLAEFAYKKINGRVLSILGTGLNDTAETIKANQFAKKIGYDGVLVVSPYYNKPSQKGIYVHFEEIANAVDIPIILYNVPSRTCSDMQADTILKLATNKNIVGIKESTSDLKKIVQLKSELKEDNFSILAGDDFQFLNFAILGSNGLISVASNVIPSVMATFISLGLKQDFINAREILFKTYHFMENLFIETNPGPIKECLSFIGLISNTVRLPLLEMEKKNREILIDSFKKVIKEFNLKLDSL